MSIYRLTSIDIGSTKSQIAQAYVESDDGCITWTMTNPNLRDTDYLIADNGETDIPTIIIKKSDLTPEQLASIDYKEDYICGKSAEQVYQNFYNFKTISEFKKDFFCSDASSEKYKKACNAIGIFLKYLYALSEKKVKQYTDVEEKTIVTVPVRCTKTEWDKMKELAEEAGWKNVEIENEAESILRYELSCSDSSLLKKIRNLTTLQTLNVLIIDIGGSTTDILVSQIRPDGKGSFIADNIGLWPEIGETDTLGGTDIDKSLCEWMIDHKFIIERVTQKWLVARGYNDFRKFKENHMNFLRNGGRIESLIGLSQYERERGKITFFSRNPYDKSKLKLDGEVFVKEIAGLYFQKLQSAIRKTLMNSNIKEKDIDFVVVSGGGSKVYGIKEMLLGELNIENPLNLTKIKEDKSLLKADASKPSALCAMGNILPPVNIPFINHVLYDYELVVDLYKLPVDIADTFFTGYQSLTDEERYSKFNSLENVYHESSEIIKLGTPLPYDTVISRDSMLTFESDVRYIYKATICAKGRNKIHRYVFDGYSYRTPKNYLRKFKIGRYFLGDNPDKIKFSYDVSFNFDSKNMFSSKIKFKIGDQFGNLTRKAESIGRK